MALGLCAIGFGAEFEFAARSGAGAWPCGASAAVLQLQRVPWYLLQAVRGQKGVEVPRYFWTLRARKPNECEIILHSSGSLTKGSVEPNR